MAFWLIFFFFLDASCLRCRVNHATVAYTASWSFAFGLGLKNSQPFTFTQADGIYDSYVSSSLYLFHSIGPNFMLSFCFEAGGSLGVLPGLDELGAFEHYGCIVLCREWGHIKK